MDEKVRGYETLKGLRAKLASVAVLVCLLLAMTSCSAGASDATAAGNSQSSTVAEATDVESGALGASTIDESLYDLECSDRDLSGEYDENVVNIALSNEGATVEGDGATYEDGTLTITEAGTYVLSGTLSDGQVVVNAANDAKVQIVLDGASITNGDGPAISALAGDKCFVTLAEGSENTLADGSDYAIDGEDEGFGAAIYSKIDLTLNGTGSLEATGSLKHAVFSQDDLIVAGGTYKLTAPNGDGLHGHDSVLVEDGSIVIDAGDDGIVSNDEDEDHGYVSIDGGTVEITAGDDGVQSFNYLRVTGGDVSIKATDDALHSDGCGKMTGGEVAIDAGDDAFHTEYVLQVDDGSLDVTVCKEGLEGQKIYVNDGAVNLTASDDAINAASPENDTTTAAADGTAASATDAAGESAAADAAGAAQDGAMPAMDTQAQGTGTIDGSQIQGMQGGMGQKDQNQHGPHGGGQPPAMQDGGQQDAATDQQGGQDMQPGGGMGGMGGGMMGEDINEECLVQINGGTIVIDASGDAVDSNGYVEFNGGIVLASGPTDSGNGSLDAALGAKMNGGTVILAGSSGMAQGFSEAGQAYVQANVSGNAGDSIAIVDADGNVLASLTAAKNFSNVIASAPGMTDGQTYSIVIGGTVTGADELGYATGTAVSGGTATEVTATTAASANGMGMGGGMQQGGPQGSMGGMPQDGAMPATGGTGQAQDATATQQDATATAQQNASAQTGGITIEDA
ncbi:MAG: carbohydrate-binding domain-containing protein [Coriobacteriales bacterium]|jgi:hypothetical protein